MRRHHLVLGIIAVLIVLVPAAAWLFIDPNKYSGLIQAQLEQQLARKVTLGKMTLGLLPLRFQAEEAVIAEDPTFGRQLPFVRADKLDVRVSLLSLLTGGVTVNSLELQRPSVELIKNKTGRWNFSSLGAGAAENPGNSSGNSNRTFTLDRLTVRDGQIAVTDLQKAQPRAVYDHIDLTLRDYTKGKPFSLDLAAHLQGEGAEEVHLKGEGGPVPEENPMDTPFRGSLSLKEVGIEGLKKFLSSEALSKVAGSLSGESQISNQSGALTAVGNLKLDGGRFNGVDVGYPIGLDFNLASKVADGLLTINNAKVLLGQTPLTVAGSLNTNATPANMNLSIKSGDVSVAEIARLLSAFGIAFAPGTSVVGRVSADLKATGSVANPALTGTVAGRELKISGKDVPQPVEVKELHVALSPSEIRSNEFNATSGKTALTGRFALRQYTSKTPVVDVVVRAAGATLPEVQSIAKAYGVTGLDRLNGAGTINLDLNASGPLESLSSADIARALNGSMNVNFKPIRIAGFDAGRELAAIGGFSSSTTAKQDFSDILLLTGHILVKNGIARTDDLKAQLAMGNLAVAGTADLAAQTLNLKLSAVLSKGFSDKVGGPQVAGYLKTVLSNSGGELVIPAIVTGTFAQPRFAPDAQALLQMQKQRLLPTFDNPAGALSGVLGSITGKKNEKNEGQEQAPAPKPADRIKGILDGILGGKKKSDQQ
ncbi:MAG TPA: AsmA family protein [Terriglobia bacterium]|nr:AsmA family protein [Terriglobia bacterium]